MPPVISTRTSNLLDEKVILILSLITVHSFYEKYEKDDFIFSVYLRHLIAKHNEHKK